MVRVRVRRTVLDSAAHRQGLLETTAACWLLFGRQLVGRSRSGFRRRLHYRIGGLALELIELRVVVLLAILAGVHVGWRQGRLIAVPVHGDQVSISGGLTHGRQRQGG